jgi:hypothetical protein
MGLFTWVEINSDLLPEQFKYISDWQTKDVVEPQMETLIVTEDGKLIYQWWEREWFDDPTYPMINPMIKGYYKRTVEHREELSYHGDMEIIGGNNNKPPFVECVCRFTEGKLDWIKGGE